MTFLSLAFGAAAKSNVPMAIYITIGACCALFSGRR